MTKSSASEGPIAPPWIGHVVAAVDEELATKTAKRSLTRLGHVNRKISGDSPLHAQFEIDLRAQSTGVDIDAARDLRLRPSDGGGQEFPVQEVLVHEPERLIVRASAHAQPPLELIADSDPTFILLRLRELIAGLSEPGLASALFEGRASGLPSGEEPHLKGGTTLNHAQQEAFDTALAPGLHMVWGPPGTGKTQVLAAVLAHVAASGRSALLVSNTNVAVDQALLKAAQATSSQPGQFVRVGMPTLEEVANHSFLPLDRACAWRAADKRQRREALNGRRAALLDTPSIRDLVWARSQLDDQRFNAAAYQAAKERLAQADRLVAARAQLVALQESLDETRSTRRTRAVELESATASVAEVTQAAEVYRQIDRLQEEIDRKEDELVLVHGAAERAADALRTTYDDLVAYSRLPIRKRVLSRAEFHRLDELRQQRQQDLQRHRDVIGRDEQALGALRQRASDRVPRLLALAGPHPRNDVEARFEALTMARQAADEAARAEQHLLDQADVLKRELEEAQRLPQPDADDAELVRTAEKLRLPQLSARIASLEDDAAPVLQELNRLEREDSELESQIRKVAGTVLQEASVVATTLARMVLHPGVGSRRYDYVFVDEAAFALPPFVVLAASRATTGVTIFGDFMQNNPIRQSDRPADPSGSKVSAHVRRWLDNDCFGLLGLDDPGTAAQVPGCVTLNEQYRFGPTINELANRVAYGGSLEVSGGREVEADEIVFVDVAGFADPPQPDIRTGSGRTWMAGALVARVLAERHGGTGEAVGIVVPYKAQQRLIASLILDTDLGANVSVGTAHKFQGREFPVVVFDLVEYTPRSLSPGWVASGRLHGSRWALDGLRLFNVAITRARRRVYLIGDGGAVAAARAGPLAEVRAMIDSGQISVIPVGKVLDGERTAPTATREPSADGGQDTGLKSVPREAFIGYRLYTESEVYEQLDELLGAAKGGSIWIWSPFVAKRAEEVLPHLERHAGSGWPVTLFVKPPLEQHGCPEAMLQRFRRAGIKAVGIHRMHQKIVILDERRTLIGSLNLLSHARGRPTAEVMLLVEGARFARELLEQQLAERFGRCPHCQAHPEVWCYAAKRKPRPSTTPGWFWCCPVPDCKQMVPIR